MSWRLLVAAGLAATVPAPAADWPQWGRDFTHNAVSPEKGVPDFRMPVADDNGKVVQAGRCLAWKADLGDRTVVPPVVAGGLVWACTNARDPGEGIKIKDWDGGVLMCFREADGKPLWQVRTPRRTEGVTDWSCAALGSVPLIEGDRLWYTNNRHEVVCLDIGPLRKGTGEPKDVWKLRMMEDLGVFGHLPVMQFGFAASVAGYKDWLYVVTHNGVDGSGTKVANPDAPSLVCLEKNTGKVVWKDNSPGKNILGHQVSSPLVAEIGGKPQVIVGQGDGWLRGFEAATGKLVWKCDLNPKAAKGDVGDRGDRNYVVATPVLYENRVYVATGREVSDCFGAGCLYCIDATRAGDVSRELDDGPGRGKPNPNSGVVWHTLGPFPEGVPDDGRESKKNIFQKRGYLFGRTIASCTVHDGLVYAADCEGYFFCFDARTGKPNWIQDLRSSVVGQPLWADGKVYVATEVGDLWAFAHGKEKKRLVQLESNSPLRPGLVFANRTVYVTTDRTLYAFRAPK